MQVARWPSFMRLRDRYRVQLSALVASQRILVANVAMLLNSESGVDRNVIYFVDNKLKTLTFWRRYTGTIHHQIGQQHYGNSPLFHDAEATTDDLFPGQTYIIGDGAYPLKIWLLTGFKDNGHLTAQRIRFTHLLSSKRMIVERSIGLLKGSFRKMNFSTKNGMNRSSVGEHLRIYNYI